MIFLLLFLSLLLFFIFIFFPFHLGEEGPFQLNKFQIDGPRAAYEAKTLKESWLLYVRVDMPGVEDDEAKVTWDEKKVCFVGEAPKQTEHEAEGRSYKGELDFTTDPVQIHDVKSDLKNGVLRMVNTFLAFLVEVTSFLSCFWVSRSWCVCHFQAVALCLIFCLVAWCYS